MYTCVGVRVSSYVYAAYTQQTERMSERPRKEERGRDEEREEGRKGEKEEGREEQTEGRMVAGSK